VRKLLGPLIEFVSTEPEPFVIVVGKDELGDPVYAPVNNPEAFDMARSSEGSDK